MGLLIWLVIAMVDPIPMEARIVTTGPLYVGQVIELQVQVVAGANPPELIAPKLMEASIHLVATTARPLTTSAIGNLTLTERVQYTSRYHLTPRRAGFLNLPPFRSKLADRVGGSNSLRIKVEPVPDAGRTREFLGGVGRFELESEVEPTLVRLGESFTYRLIMTGEASVGSTRDPQINAELLEERGLVLTPEPVESRDEPPTRVFRYRVRATSPGVWSMPPVRISAFDPTTNHYLTKSTSSANVRVKDIPLFQPNKWITPGPSSPKPKWHIVEIAGLIIGLATIGAVFGWVRVRLARLRTWPRTMQKRFDANFSQRDVARLFLTGLFDHLNVSARKVGPRQIRPNLSDDPPTPALTSDEVREVIESRTGDHSLAQKVADVVERCDRVLYGGHPDDQLSHQIKELLDDWSRLPIKR